MGFIPQSGQSAPPLINVCRGATLGPGREIAFTPSRARPSLFLDATTGYVVAVAVVVVVDVT